MQEHIEKKAKELGFKRRMKIRDSLGGRFADAMTRWFGTVWFLVFNALFFLAWILINLGTWPVLPVFDEFPFILLTMFVSLEAIFLSVIVLISQNRAGEIADMREDLDFENNVRAEEEITKIINMLDEIHDHLGLPNEDDDELRGMKEKTDIERLGRNIRDEE
jgi:uncharacterized membrane protein